MSETKLAVIDSHLPGYMKNAFESLEGMKQIAQMYADSRTIPDHFYEKTPDGKTDYTKPKIASIQAVLTRGYELDLKATTSLQSVIPINGLLTLKVDLMKSMIFASGTMEKGGWIEREEGSIDVGSYTVTVTGKRRDNGMTLTRSFSVADAKRAGLWITKEMLSKQDGWRYKQSAWFKYPARMVGTRAAGFLCRDLWGDVIDNSVSFEEARDYPEDTTVVIEKDGKEIIIPDKDFNNERSQSLTSKAVEKIDKGTQPAPEPEPDPAPEKELPDVFYLTEEALIEKKTEILLSACEKVELTRKAVILIEGRNTNKKLREIILAHQKGTLEATVANLDPNAGKGDEKATPSGPAVQGSESEIPPPTEPAGETGPLESETAGGDAFEPVPERDDHMEPNANFDNPPEETEPEPVGDTPVSTNEYGLEIPEPVGGERTFDTMKDLWDILEGIDPPIDGARFDELNVKFLEGKFKNKEEFCRYATVDQVNLLLNSN